MTIIRGKFAATISESLRVFWLRQQVKWVTEELLDMMNRKETDSLTFDCLIFELRQLLAEYRELKGWPQS